MSRANQWFVPGDGIAREVITADIQRYLGPDALVRPGPGNGEYEGRSGYWITAYRTLTSQMIQDLKMDSQRWQQEQGRQEAGRGVAYQDSRTHAARQHWGPTAEGYDQARQPSRPQQYTTPQHAPQQYGTSEHYTTTTPTASSAYGGSHQAYQVPPTAHAAPRTQPDPNSYYQQPGRDHSSSYATPQQYSYPQQPQDYGRNNPTAPPPTHGYPPSAAVQPGYYIASDGRQYPLPAAQTPAQQPPQGGRRRTGN